MSQAKIYWDRDNYAQVEKVRVNYGPTSTVVDWQASRVGHMVWRIKGSGLVIFDSTPPPFYSLDLSSIAWFNFLL